MALNFEEINKEQQRVLNIRSFINNHNWIGRNYPSKIEDQKKIEKNPTVSLNIL